MRPTPSVEFSTFVMYLDSRSFPIISRRSTLVLLFPLQFRQLLVHLLLVLLLQAVNIDQIQVVVVVPTRELPQAAHVVPDFAVEAR